MYAFTAAKSLHFFLKKIIGFENQKTNNKKKKKNQSKTIRCFFVPTAAHPVLRMITLINLHIYIVVNSRVHTNVLISPERPEPRKNSYTIRRSVQCTHNNIIILLLCTNCKTMCAK